MIFRPIPVVPGISVHNFCGLEAKGCGSPVNNFSFQMSTETRPMDSFLLYFVFISFNTKTTG